MSNNKEIKKRKWFWSALPVSSVRFIVTGGFLSKGLVLKHLDFLGYITFLMVLYISYNNYVDSTIRATVKEEKIGDELYSELQSLIEQYNKESLQSKVAEEVADLGLLEGQDPPVVIEIH